MTRSKLALKRGSMKVTRTGSGSRLDLNKVAPEPSSGSSGGGESTGDEEEEEEEDTGPADAMTLVVTLRGGQVR